MSVKQMMRLRRNEICHVNDQLTAQFQKTMSSTMYKSYTHYTKYYCDV